MLRLTRRVDYSILILSHLCQAGEKPISANDVAKHYGISPALVANLMKTLVKSGWLVSMRGKNGGYRLTRKPNEMNLDDLLNIMEGSFSLAICTGHHPEGEASQDCFVAKLCPARSPLQKVHQRIHDFLKETTFADMIPPEWKKLELAKPAVVSVKG